MSDLQDIIVSSSVKAFNSGLAHGVIQERERIIKLAQNRICFDHKDSCEHGACYALCDLIELVKGEQK